MVCRLKNGSHIKGPQVTNQFMGQLVVPVYEGKKLVGFIELTTHKPKKDYADEFLRLSSLLKREGLATKGLTV
ncbi:hypothetical protein E3N88_30893 [Mikania micrantha]|uniref:GAF domain-containing protein n=1 Tax=Mikania micrantha TaxID=192012 RepID=A0A5N6MNU9_9ASTR|nr:hypothetical protein E3N88_30893 [Mikania micrantha]